MSQNIPNDGTPLNLPIEAAAPPLFASKIPYVVSKVPATALSDSLCVPLSGITGAEATGVLLHQLTKRNELLVEAADGWKNAFATLVTPTIAEKAASFLVGENPWLKVPTTQTDAFRKAGVLNEWLTGLPSNGSPLEVESKLSSEVGKLRQDIAQKEATVRQQEGEIRLKTEELKKVIESKTATESERLSLQKQVEELRQASFKQAENLSDLQKRFDLSFILTRVSSIAGQRLISDTGLQERFTKAGACKAFVLALDIRRSTELMLRAKTPELFAEFLDALCSRLVETVKCHFGVVDKFTGDGLLAYFPDFFCGTDAAYWVLAASRACHKVFEESYRANRHCFSVVLKDVGLGIGIDFGEVHLVRVNGELTAIGAPVVYACRFSGAPSGCTYLNYPAFTEASAKLAGHLQTDEAAVEVKHEGTVVCLSVSKLSVDYRPAMPSWAGSE